MLRNIKYFLIGCVLAVGYTGNRYKKPNVGYQPRRKDVLKDQRDKKIDS